MRRSYSLALPVYAPTLLLSIGQGVLLPTLPLYAKSYGVSTTLVALAVSAAGIGTLLGDVPTGTLLERYGRKPVMVVGTVSLAISSYLLATWQVFPALLALRVVFGLGTAMWNISRMAYVTDVVPVQDRGRALSTFGGVNRVGTFIGPALGGVIAARYGLASPFFVSAITAAMAAVISILFVAESRQHLAAGRRQMRWRLVGTLVAHHWKELGTAGSAQIFAQMIRNGRQLIVPLYGQEVLGLSEEQIGAIFSISSAVDMSLFLPAGFLMDKLGRKFASVPSFVVMAVGMAVLPFTTNYIGLLGATCIMALGNGIGSGTMMTLGADLAPREATGEFLGVWRLIGDVGQSGGPMAVGAIADVVGLTASAMCLSGIGVLAAVTLLLFVRETLAQGPSPGPGSGPVSVPVQAG